MCATGPEVVAVQRWCDAALQGLASAREEIDALNVYPVPDSDTGTNLYLTMEAAAAALGTDCPDTLEPALRRLSRHALLGAHGNSGVIVAQLIRAAAEHVIHDGAGPSGRVLADALSHAADAAYEAVAEPVEGTILTVARAAADAAEHAARGQAGAPAVQASVVIHAAADAARKALAHTPDQLPVLRDSGVVDAGGQGLCVLLDAAEEVLTGHPNPSARTAQAPTPIPPHPDLTAQGPDYEVMYLLDADDAAIPSLRERLAPLGDSLLVVGGDRLWNVHVHVDDVGAAIEAGVEAGSPYRIRVTHFAEQGRAAQHGTAQHGTEHHGTRRGPAEQAGTEQRNRPGASHHGRQTVRGVVAYAAGAGLAQLFGDAGAVVPDRTASRPGAEELRAAIQATDAAEVIVLPNTIDLLDVSEAAAHLAREKGVRCAVIPTRAQVQGLAAIAVHDPGRDFDEDVVHMTSAAAHARHGAVTIAEEDAMTTAGACVRGDVLGVVDGDFAVVGTSLAEVAVDVVGRLLAGGGEMVTLVTGVGSHQNLVTSVETALDTTAPAVELVVHGGGQERYPLLIGVE